MIEKNSGMVINIASMAGKGGVAYLVDYWYVPLMTENYMNITVFIKPLHYINMPFQFSVSYDNFQMKHCDIFFVLVLLKT